MAKVLESVNLLKVKIGYVKTVETETNGSHKIVSLMASESEEAKLNGRVLKVAFTNAALIEQLEALRADKTTVNINAVRFEADAEKGTTVSSWFIQDIEYIDFNTNEDVEREKNNIVIHALKSASLKDLKEVGLV